jgi:hypothetical protein
MIIGIMVQDTTKKATLAELIGEAARMFEKRMGAKATHAQIGLDGDAPVIEGMVVSQVRHVRPHCAVAGVPVEVRPVGAER